MEERRDNGERKDYGGCGQEEEGEVEEEERNMDGDGREEGEVG